VFTQQNAILPISMKTKSTELMDCWIWKFGKH